MDINVQQTSLTKEWEFIRINSNSSDSSEEDIYVLLHIVETKKHTTHQLEIEIIPAFINSFYYRDSIYFRTWTVEVRLFGGIVNGQVKFAFNGDFIIKLDILRGKGLGSYVLGKLVRWVKQSCFASLKAKKHQYDAIWFSRIQEIKCHSN